MKRLTALLIMVVLLSACSTQQPLPGVEELLPTNPPKVSAPAEEGSGEKSKMDSPSVSTPTNEEESKISDQNPEPSMNLLLTIGDKEFTVTLQDTPCCRELLERLPLTANMSELNGNEKYFRLDSALPAAAEAVGSIHMGDLMLYGTDYIVLFYQDFPTSYHYTRLGTVDDAAKLAEAVGAGTITMTFKKSGI